MAGQKTAVSLSVLHIPIELHKATTSTDISFNQLHKKDYSRVKQKNTCAHCGKELTSSDIVKGYQYEKDRYVIVTSEDLEKIKTEKDKIIHILHTTKLETIRPVYYNTTYHAIPIEGGEKAYEVLRQALMSEQLAAITKTVLGTKETRIALIPREDGILAQTLFFEAEVKDLPKTYSRPEVGVEEVNLARQLVSKIERPFVPEEHHNEYQERLRELIAAKIAGKEVVTPGKPQQQGANSPVVNLTLLEQLQGSMREIGA